MATIQRIRVGLTGFPGAPGLMTLFCSDPNTFIAPLRDYLTAMAPHVPADVLFTIHPEVDVIESTTGVIFSTGAINPGAPIAGTSSGGYSAPTGYVVEWLTSIHLSGRLLRGKTFFVPGAGASFGTDGQILPATLVSIKSASTAFQLATLGNFVIWQRPRKARPANGTVKAVEARGGGHGTVASSRVPAMAAVLRSRRN